MTIASALTLSNQSQEDSEEALYFTVNRLGWSDDFKADVYAQLAETITPDMGFAAKVEAVERAIHSTYHSISHG